MTHALVVCGADNSIGEEGAKALGPHLAKLSKLTLLQLWGPFYLRASSGV